MSILRAALNDNLLNYAISTSPDPVQVSPQEGNPCIASLYVVVSNGTSDPLYCNQIVFSFLIGPLAQDLTNQAQGILVSASPSDKWHISVTADGVFTATPTKPEYAEITTDGLAFQIYSIQVNQQVGTFAFTIQETSSTDNEHFSQHTNGYNLAKFPYGFFVSNFTSKTPLINDGQTATLTWIGSDQATYTLLYAAESVDVTNVRTWTSPPLHNATTFILKATAQIQGETVETYLSTTVIVANPELVAATLQVTGASALNGETTIGSESGNANLTVGGAATVRGNASVGGTMGVTGAITGDQVTANNLNANGNINAQGTVNAGGLAVNGDATVGSLSACQMTTSGFRCNGTVFAPLDGPYNAGIFTNDGIQYTLGTRNHHSDTGYITGIVAFVATSSDYGLGTNGKIGSCSGNAMLTHLPTRNGYRVVTSPLCLEAEVHVSGHARLSEGKAVVQFDTEAADIIFHSGERTYKVILTPTGRCRGLAVMHKSQDHFIVEELAEGRSNAAFDWLVIAHKRAALGASNPQKMPERLPEMEPPLEQGIQPTES